MIDYVFAAPAKKAKAVAKDVKETEEDSEEEDVAAACGDDGRDIVFESNDEGLQCKYKL